jgi:putative ABC transport system permease protein
MSRRVSTRALVAHHLRSHAGGGAILGLLVLVLSLLATAAPLALAQLGDATVRDRIDTLSPTVRDVVSTTPGLPQIGGSGPSLETDEVWAPFLGELERVRSSADRPLPAVLGAPVAIARTAPAPRRGPEDASALRRLLAGFLGARHRRRGSSAGTLGG